MTSPDGHFAPVAPELFVRDVDATLRFYVDVLDFKVLRRDEHAGVADFAVIARGDDVRFLIAHQRLATDGPLPGRRGAGIDIRVMVDDVDAIYAKAQAAGAVAFSIADRDYGLRDFKVRDPDGFVVRIAQPLSS